LTAPLIPPIAPARQAETKAQLVKYGVAVTDFGDLIRIADRLGGFPSILSDAPWHFKVRSSKGEGRSACQHYNVPT
jgi:hypothetical protein